MQMRINSKWDCCRTILSNSSWINSNIFEGPCKIISYLNVSQNKIAKLRGQPNSEQPLSTILFLIMANNTKRAMVYIGKIWAERRLRSNNESMNLRLLQLVMAVVKYKSKAVKIRTFTIGNLFYNAFIIRTIKMVKET